MANPTIPVEQAACNALKAYLQTFLATPIPGVIVSGRWPSADKPLPGNIVSILRVGTRRTLDGQPYVLRKVSDDSATLATYLWRVAAVTQGMQLDAWATTQAARDKLQAAVDQALTQGLGVTLGLTGKNPFRDGPLLAMSDGYEGNVDFTFDGPEIADTADRIQQDEYRVTYAGNFTVSLDLQAQSPRMLQIKLREILANVHGTDEYTLTSTGLTSSYTP